MLNVISRYFKNRAKHIHDAGLFEEVGLTLLACTTVCVFFRVQD